MQDKQTQLLEEMRNILYHIHEKIPTPCQNQNQSVKKEEKWLDNQEVMQLLHLSVSTLQRLRMSGQLPYHKVKGKIWYAENDVHEMIKKGKH